MGTLFLAFPMERSERKLGNENKNNFYKPQKTTTKPIRNSEWKIQHFTIFMVNKGNDIFTLFNYCLSEEAYKRKYYISTF